MKFKSHYTGNKPMLAIDVIAREALYADPYQGGTLERLTVQNGNLCQVVCAIITLLTEEQQEALVAHFAPSYKRIEEK